MNNRRFYAGWIGNVLRAGLCAFALLGVSLTAQASFPATSTNGCDSGTCSGWRSYLYGENPQGAFGDPVAACQHAASRTPSSSGTYSNIGFTAPNTCTATYTPSGGGSPSSTSSGSWIGPYTITPEWGCPANATLTGETCNCVANYSQGAGACTLTTSVESKTIQDLLNLSGNSLSYKGTTYQTEACYEGYVMKGTGSALGIKDGNGVGEIYGPFTATGAVCTGQPEASAGTCKAGEFSGTINGAAACVAAQGRQDIGSTVTATPPAPGASTPAIPGAPPTATTSQTSTSCTGNQCTTTTTYKDGAGTTVGTVAKADSLPSFCSQNPGSSICKPQADDCERDPSRIGCSQVDTPTGPAMPGTTVSLGFAAETPFASDGACPISGTMTVGSIGKTVKPWDWQKVCDSAVPVRALVLALATLTGIFIVFGGGKVMAS